MNFGVECAQGQCVEGHSALCLLGGCVRVKIDKPSCCDPEPCGFAIESNRRTFTERQADWEEEARGWSGL